MEHWEYRTIKISLRAEITAESIDEDLAALGKQGWELVAVVTASSPHEHLVYTFKRPVRK